MRLLCLLLLFAACLPAPHSVIGASCSDSDPCPESQFCVFGKCSESVPPDVTLLSSTFEGGTSTLPWVGGRLMVGPPAHGGASSMRVQGSDGPPPMTVNTSDDAFPVATGLHCVSGWAMHGTMANGPISLLLKAYTATGALESSSAPVSFTVPAAGRSFQRLATELFIDSSTVSRLTIELSCECNQPADFFVDDVTLIRTASGACPP